MTMPVLRSSAGAARLAFIAMLVLAPLRESRAEPSSAPSASGAIQFNRDIRPILSDNCFACHGFDTKKRKAGLRLDVAEGALGAGDSGKAAIKPGAPLASEVWRRLVTEDADDRMPPRDSHKQLKPAQLELLRRWIEEGARYEKHWAFEPPAKAPVPPVTGPTDSTNPIDRFLGDRLRREGLAPSREVDRETLIRRLSFDLTGLPPTPAEVDAFVHDGAPGAYDRLVERLLDSPRYGEQMAVLWLDVARYADTHGLHLDNERSMWPYRDWVVRAFNRNQPFDQFTVEQLAGDLLPDPTPDQLTATGFNRNNVSTSEGGSIDAEFVYRYAVDRTATTVQTWMGLTAGCAVCHDHKFDPLTTKEFYSMYSFFHSAADPAMDGNIQRTPPVIRLRTPGDDVRLVEFDREISEADGRVLAAVERIEYTDPATLHPPPPGRDVENVWADDDAPAGWKVVASPGAATRFVTQDQGPVASGMRALRRQDKGLAQDVFEAGSEPVVLPQAPRLFAYVHLDPSDPPKAVMLQYRVGDWKHRAVWGDYEAIDWGARGTTERVNQGALPKAGEWVRLEVDAAALGLQAGDKVTGFAVTQFGGTVHWDKIGVAGRIDPANDAQRSFLVWSRQYDGKEPGELPADLRVIFKKAPDSRSSAEKRRLREHFIARVYADARSTFDPLIGAASALRKQREAFEETIPATFVWRDLEQPRESFVMQRGAYDRPGEKVGPGVPEVLPPLKTDGSRRPNRLDFARWLVADEHPLTARVTVNRFWQQFFGTGLVKTSEDFGSQGEPPSHPELLDWLAVTFREMGWNVKDLVRLVVRSAAYRQSSRVTPELLARDPENRLLARSSRFRLAAEQIRDNALYVSGLLVPTMGGKGVKPYQPPNIWEPVGFVGSNTRDYRPDTGPALYRRSLYTFFKRTAPPPYVTAFDGPNREQSCSRRDRSNTPLQALQLLNDVQHVEAARALAQRMLREGGATPEERIHFGFRTVLARRPDMEEVAVIRRALAAHLERYAARPDAARELVQAGASKPDPALPAPELAAYTLAANLLLNLDETLTRN